MAIVTFTTDFGTADGYVGAMKGVVLSLAPGAVLVDITHDVPARDIRAGAFALATAAPLFPAGTIHVAVVDPGVGGARAAVVVHAGSALYVGPDNGLLTLAARGPRSVHLIQDPAFRRDPVSPTFHGRDLFAAAAGQLASGRAPTEAGPVLGALGELPLSAVGLAADEGEVIHVDVFGNLITSFAGDTLGPGAWMLGRNQGDPLPLIRARTYADAAPGQLLAYVGSGGWVEIAVRDGSAAAVTGLRRGDRIWLRRPA